MTKAPHQHGFVKRQGAADAAPTLKGYLVEWSVNTLAASPEEAALKALELIERKEFDLNVMTVTDDQGEQTNVDVKALSSCFHLSIKVGGNISLAEQISALDYALCAADVADTELVAADFQSGTITVSCLLSTPYSQESVHRLIEDSDYAVQLDGIRLPTEIIEVVLK